MAKSSLPRIDGSEPQQQTRREPPAAAEVQSVPASEGYIPRNVDVRMTRVQARILRDKLRQLQDAGARTADGKHVDNRAQAVRWILENEVVQ
jgi:hypothetical protein